MKPFDLSTHNGIITIRNPVTGNHRTVKIKTSSEWDKRWVMLLVDPDNTSDYQSFARVINGVAVPFRKLDDDSFYAKLCDILNDPDKWADRLEFSFAARCIRCNKLLTEPNSIKLGIGPECRRK